MKKVLILLAAIMMVAVSCTKPLGAGGKSKILPGTTWETSDGQYSVTFTDKTISVTDFTHSTSSATYTLTVEVPTVSCSFNIDHLTVGDNVFTSGFVNVGIERLTLMGPNQASMVCYKK